MKKTIVIFYILMVSAGIGFADEFAVDFTQGPESVPPGSILLSGGLAFGNATGRSGGWSASSGLFGFSFAADYALANYGLTVGGETGVYYAGGWVDAGIIPFMGRLGYHPNFGVDNLDVYGLFKLGFSIFLHEQTHFGLGIGFGVGGRYFFTDNIGAFVELGLDIYSFNGSGISGTGRKFFTAGLTYKL